MSLATCQPAKAILYNSKELDKDPGLNWYSYGARMYDAAVGRFTGVDAFAPALASWSPYTYTYDNPLAHTDPLGLAPSTSLWGDEIGAEKRRRANRRLEKTKEIVENRIQSKNLVDGLIYVAKFLSNSESTVKAIHFVFESYTEKIYHHTVQAQTNGHPSILHIIKGDESLKKTNRKEALRGYKRGYLSPDEYPYASTYEGGAGASVMYVPLDEQRRQGSTLSILSSLLNDGDAFTVVPIPRVNEANSVMSVLERFNLNLSQTSATSAKKNEVRLRVIWKAVKSLPSKAAIRLFPPVYIGPGSGFPEDYRPPSG